MPDIEQYFRNKLDELKSHPVGILAVLYPYILIAGLAIGLVYIGNLNEIARTKVPAKVPDSTAVTNDQKVVQAKNVPPLDIMTASQPSPELIDKGKTIFTNVCQSCHGPEGKGNGPASAGLNPPPRNFTSTQGWINGPKISGIYKTLQEGVPGSAMASYDYLLPEEKIGLAHFIRQTFVPNPPKDTQDDLTLLDQTYQLSKGQVISAQIPVDAAVNIVTNENSANVEKVLNTVNEISADTLDPGAKIFTKVAGNKEKAITLLSRSPEWKSNRQVFVSSIVNEVNQNGFNYNVFTLTGDEWNTLQSFLSKYF